MDLPFLDVQTALGSQSLAAQLPSRVVSSASGSRSPALFPAPCGSLEPGVAHMWLRAELREQRCAGSLVLVILLTNLPLMCQTEGAPAHFPVSHHNYLDLLG